METLAREFLETLERGEPDPGRLALVGEPDPARAAECFARAARQPALAPTRAQWVAALLATARPGFGAAQLEALAERHAELRGRPLDPALAPTLARVVGSSNFLARLLLRHPALADDLAGELPAPPDAIAPAPDWSAIRAAKYRGLLRITARDLLGRPLREALRELSDLADRCLAAALEAAARETALEAPSLLALGKLGGRELNFSSDVDLLFLYDAPSEAADLARNQEVSRLVQTFKRGLESPAEDGFGYRVDLDLRPEGPRGVLANSVDAALTYYESFGMEWERQMLIRLRPVAGPPGPAASFARAIVPFVYRRLIDPGVARAVREMKARIEAERTRAGRDLEADLKEGPGGIRDVEFLVQALQLFHGGREPSIRVGNVLEALERLGRRGLLPASAAADLAEAYIWLRRTEHALQMVEERQTQRFPRDAAGQLALARRLGYDETEGARARDRLLDDWTAVRADVRAHFDALVLREET